jgi:molecular chaperone GrpE (heat shock protein)
MFAMDLIKRLDLIDILIQRYAEPGANGGVEQQLRTLRSSFEDILAQHGVAAFSVPPGTVVDLNLRQRISIVESIGGQAKPRVIESYRSGFVYSPYMGQEVVLRKVEVKTSSQ